MKNHCRYEIPFLIGFVLGVLVGGISVWSGVAPIAALEDQLATAVAAMATPTTYPEQTETATATEAATEAETATPVFSTDFCNQWVFGEYQVLIEKNSDLLGVAIFHADAARNLMNACLKNEFDKWWPHASGHVNESIRAMTMLHTWLTEQEEQD